MASDDFASSLYAEINEKLEKSIDNDKSIQRILSKAEKGKATSYDLNVYSTRLGKLTSNTLRNTFTEEILGEEGLFEETAQKTVGKVLDDNLKRVNSVGAEVHNSLNKSAGIGLKSVNAKMDVDRKNGLIFEICKGGFDDMEYWLVEPVINIVQNMYANFIKENANFQQRSGLAPTLDREASIDCCSWCADKEGHYEGSFPDDVFQRHDYCRCTITFNPQKGDGRVQDSWSKEWMSEEKAAKREERKQYHAERTWVKNDEGKYRRT